MHWTRWLSVMALVAAIALARSALASAASSQGSGPGKRQQRSCVGRGCAAPSWETLVDEFRELQELVNEAQQSMSLYQRTTRFQRGEDPAVQPKNRYSDVLPLESSRVRLKPLPNDHTSDYINGNWLLKRRYISTQAPLPNTFHDFWRMVLAEQVTVIVMLTRLKEGGMLKAHQYWPAAVGDDVAYGSVTVELQDVLEEGAIRTSLLRLRDGAGHVRDVYHLHYTGWPDFGAPEDAVDVLELVRNVDMWRMKAAGSKGPSPVVVHCSAGIGRSGSFIAIHHAIHALRERPEEPVELFDLVHQMRRERNGMVQREEQYAFIFKALQQHLEGIARAGQEEDEAQDEDESDSDEQ